MPVHVVCKFQKNVINAFKSEQEWMLYMYKFMRHMHYRYVELYIWMVSLNTYKLSIYFKLLY